MKFLRLSELTNWLLQTRSAAWVYFWTVLKLLCLNTTLAMMHWSFKVLSDTQMLKLQLLVIFVTQVDKFVSLHHQHQGIAFYSLTTLIGQAAFNAFMNLYWYTQSLNWFPFDEDLADAEKDNGLERSPMPKNHLIWKAGMLPPPIFPWHALPNRD